MIHDEIDAVRHTMSRSNPGDLVVVCVDKHPAVMTELENWSQRAQAGSGASDVPVGDPDFAPAPAAADASDNGAPDGEAETTS